MAQATSWELVANLRVAIWQTHEAYMSPASEMLYPLEDYNTSKNLKQLLLVLVKWQKPKAGKWLPFHQWQSGNSMRHKCRSSAKEIPSCRALRGARLQKHGLVGKTCKYKE
jgi:hypothetical protein